jgi:hypothetical protein
MFAERQGYHLPDSPSEKWASSSPILDGIKKAGVGFYTASFELDIPDGWDVPMGFVFNGTESGPSLERTVGNYKVQFFVNGFQFGKYGNVSIYPTRISGDGGKVNNLGPQTSFPVPEGILNYNGKNTVALTLWSLDPTGAKLKGFQLVPHTPIKSGYVKPGLVAAPAWSLRKEAY